MAIHESVTQSVAESNFKNLGDAPAFFLSLAYSDAVAHQRSINSIRETALSQAIKGLLEVDPMEALSVVKGLTGNDLAQQLNALSASLAAIQQQIKVAQTTPPETGK